jgi:hypothetical protein
LLGDQWSLFQNEGGPEKSPEKILLLESRWIIYESLELTEYNDVSEYVRTAFLLFTHDLRILNHFCRFLTMVY